MMPGQIIVGRCYRIRIDERLLIAKVLEVTGTDGGIVRWMLQGTAARHYRVDPLVAFASWAEAEVAY